MSKIKTSIVLVTTFFVLTLDVFASASSKVELKPANTDINDIASLQNGVKLFINYCSGCHSLKYMRYERIAKDLNISKKLVRSNLIFTGKKIGDTITTAMSVEHAKSWFGHPPPDLSLVARSKGVDWIYNYLHAFYPDESGLFGSNNHILSNTSMPDILANRRAKLDSIDFDKDVRDISNFLDYVGEPIKSQRIALGYKVILFLFILLILSFFLKKEYWQDVKYGMWKARD